MNRQIPLAGCHNFRDLGGYPTADGGMVRWRTLFRSDGLEHLTAADVACLRDELRIGDVVDLRSSGELRAEGRGPLANEPVRFHHLPLFDGDTTRARSSAPEMSLGRRYFLLAGAAREPIAAVLNVVAASDAAAVYHCAAGKDRTGVISAIVLALLDVPDAVIAADYAATRENLDAIVERLMSRKGYRNVLADLPPDTLHAEPETILEFLDLARAEWGTMADYARGAGIGDDTLARLRARLIDR